MKPILVVVPSLRRADNAAKFVEHWRATTDGSSDLLFVLEDNDPTIADYPSGETYLIGEYRSLGNAFNAAFAEYPDYAAYAPLNDDHWFRTQDWEAAATAALTGGGVVYGNDGFQGERLATAPILDGDMVRALGYISPPGIPHLYIDDSWMHLGGAIGRLTYLPDLLIEHMHPEAGKAEWDETYRSANSSAAYERDRAAYNDWLSGPAAADIERARGSIR